MQAFWKRVKQKIQENATGILGTIAFHLVLILIFLAVRISTEKSRLEDLIVVDFDESPEPDRPETEMKNTDPEFEQKLAQYLAEPRSNIPVNLARQIDRQLSTKDYVKEIEKDLDANRSEEYKETQEKLRELEQIRKEDLIAEGSDTTTSEPVPYEGPTNIFYTLKGRTGLDLPVPVYKCEGGGMVEVKIAVDQRGRVVQAETDKPGDSANEICLVQAALKAAYGSLFNTDYSAPARQLGTITYHFVPQ